MNTTAIHSEIKGIRRSFAGSARRSVTPTGTGRPLKYGDRIYVRLVDSRMQLRTLVELTLTDVNDLSEVYGEIRRHTRGHRGLAEMYIRNVTRGWSLKQPFMLYPERVRMARSVTQPVIQPESAAKTTLRVIPESIRLRYQY